MNKRKAIKILFIFIVTLIVLVLAEVILRNIVGGVNKFIAEKKEQHEQKKEYNSDEAVEQRQVEDFINNIYVAIDKEDYDFIYDNLDEIYREYKFNNNKSELISYIKDNNMKNGSRSISNVNKKVSRYYVLVGITSGDSLKSQRFTVVKDNENNLKFMFDEFVSLEKESKNATYGDMSYDVIYIYKTMDYITYVIKIKNNSSNTKNMVFNNIYADARSSIKGNSIQPFEINPNMDKTIELTFPRKESIARVVLEGTCNNEAINVQFAFSGGMGYE